MTSKIKIVFLALLPLAGCASAPDIAPQHFVAPPSSKSLSTLIVYRANSVPKGVDARLKLNDTLKAYLPDNRVTWIQVPPGRHRLTVEFPVLVGMVSPKIEREFAPGVTYYFRYDGEAPTSGVPIIGQNGIILGSVGGGGRFRNQLVEVSEGQGAAASNRLLYVPHNLE